VKNRPTLAPADLPPPKQVCCSAGGWKVAYAMAFLGMWDCPKLAPSDLPPPKQGSCSAVGWKVAYATALAECRNVRIKVMKGGRKMKGSKKMTVLGPEGSEDGLMGMGRLIEAGGR
jgi:hypothetical protein